MIEPIKFQVPSFERRFDFDTEELTQLELSGRTAKKTNEVVELVNTFDADLKTREKSDDITNKRKLSPTGNFSGTILGVAVLKILTDISDALSLVKTLISMVNNRESIGTIYDGGYFLESDPPVINVEGGLF